MSIEDLLSRVATWSRGMIEAGWISKVPMALRHLHFKSRWRDVLIIRTAALADAFGRFAVERQLVRSRIAQYNRAAHAAFGVAR